jgi:hypothetical protein
MKSIGMTSGVRRGK